MTSGRRLTDSERWSVLRLNWQQVRISIICRETQLDYRTVRLIIDEAARQFYSEHKPSWIDRLKAWP